MNETEKLVNASKLLIYYIRMYRETLDWLNHHRTSSQGWDFQGNSILDAHLLYSRLLIEFIIGTPKKKRSSDRFVISFFGDMENPPFPVNSDTLKKYKGKIDKQLAHITVDMYPEFMMKSEQVYEVNEIANELVPLLINFFELVPAEKIHDSLKEQAMTLLQDRPSFDLSKGWHPST